MDAVKINPLKLVGPWTDGYVLERQHTLSSDFLGYDSNGHAQFDTNGLLFVDSGFTRRAVAIEITAPQACPLNA